MSIKNVYKSYIPSVNYVTVRGRTCIFREGRYETDVQEEIAELEHVVSNKSNPHIFVDPEEKTIDTTLRERIQKAMQEAAERVLSEANAEGSNKEENKGGSQVAQVPGNQQGMSAASLVKTVVPAMNTAGLAAVSGK